MLSILDFLIERTYLRISPGLIRIKIRRSLDSGVCKGMYEEKVCLALFCSPADMQLPSLVNLLPNGPNDGGLIVCKGAHKLSEQFHREMAWEQRIPQWTPEWYGFTENGMKWLEDHGCEWIKVCADPGDLLL